MNRIKQIHAERRQQHGVRGRGGDHDAGRQPAQQRVTGRAGLPQPEEREEQAEDRQRRDRLAKEMRGVGPGDGAQPEDRAGQHGRAEGVAQRQHRLRQQHAGQRRDHRVEPERRLQHAQAQRLDRQAAAQPTDQIKRHGQDRRRRALLREVVALRPERAQHLTRRVDPLRPGDGVGVERAALGHALGDREKRDFVHDVEAAAAGDQIDGRQQSEQRPQRRAAAGPGFVSQSFLQGNVETLEALYVGTLRSVVQRTSTVASVRASPAGPPSAPVAGSTASVVGSYIRTISR